MIAIENEILVTLVGTLVIVLITIFQIWAMSRSKFRHHQKMLALENSLNQNQSVINKGQALPSRKEKCSLFCNVKYLLQIIFGILVFVSFTCWAVYLVSVGFIEWAPLPGSLALIGLMTPIIAWRGFKHRHQAMNWLIRDIENSKKAGLQEDQKASEQVEPPIIAKPEPVRQVVAEAVVLPEKQVEIRTTPIVIEKQKLPQDSILRRHFLTHLRFQVESGYPSRPTDSILKRHFDNFIVTEMQKYVDGPIEPAAVSGKACSEACTKTIEHPVIAQTATAAVIEHQKAACVKSTKQTVPQDSILRRHFLTQLRFDIEARLWPRPTDSILKRHYDSLIAMELAKRLEEMQA